ncbi:MAG TPA: hypothetical protein VJK71_01290 [Gemmatimonadales bacterium]|nr:hypothetical protein [Gemmatimonadales bacterium]
MSRATAAEPRGTPLFTLGDLRRRLAAVPGLVPATVEPPASHGRAEEARIIPAELIEPRPLGTRALGPPEAWPGPVAFLDGIQRYVVLAYAGTMPVVGADVAAAVRERNGREARTVISERRRLLIGRPEALALAAAALPGIRTVALAAEEPSHPLRDLELARAVVDRARGEVELSVGNAYRRGASHWLVVDGSLAESPVWTADPRMIGVAKSHATLPFGGPDLVTYLHLPAGHRSSVFRPASRHRAPVYAWGLRLWDWAGRDLFFGLVRVEAAPTEESLRLADSISRWLLAERAPVSADARWDRLLYGIHGVEEYLRAQR